LRAAVRCGGGVNHRMSLSDAALVKDNHVVAAGGVAAAFEAVRAMFPGLAVEVEVDSLGQLTEVLDAGADLVLLDNFKPDQMRPPSGSPGARAPGGARAARGIGGLTPGRGRRATGVGMSVLTRSHILDVGADLPPIPENR
jgi:nicotinate-nucleotide pyrophosphorylase (carboxylating)